MSEKLKPCPFCGGSNIRFDCHPQSGQGTHYGENVWSMCCYQCGASVPNMYGEFGRQQMVEGWNSRVVDDEIVKPLCAQRFKLSFNKAGNCTTLRNFAEQLDGQWVWLIDATDGMNDPLVAMTTHPTPTNTTKREIRAAEER